MDLVEVCVDGEKNIMLSDVHAFCTRLRWAGKDISADYFETVLTAILTLPGDALSAPVLIQVRRSAELAGIAHFSHEEEQLYRKLVERTGDAA
jgi:hypothetical protein